MTTQVEGAELRAIAVQAEAHPRTVARRIKGEPVRGLSAQRIDRALEGMGWTRVILDGSLVGWTRRPISN